MNFHDKNFGKLVCAEEDKYQLILPDSDKFMDLHGGMQVIFDHNIHEIYMKNFNLPKNITSQNMYAENYLKNLRIATSNSENYIKAEIFSEYRKNTTYNIHLKLSQNGFTIESECECGAGAGPTAHCKHEGIVLEALQDFVLTRSIKRRVSCTSALQTFHVPKKKYNASPIKSKDLKLHLKNNSKSLDGRTFDPRPEKYRKQANYISFFNNACISFASLQHQSFPML